MYLTLHAECSIMPRRNHDIACAKTWSCVLTLFSVAYTTSISGRQRALTEVLRTTRVYCEFAVAVVNGAMGCISQSLAKVNLMFRRARNAVTGGG